jgi:hypothetical protein
VPSSIKTKSAGKTGQADFEFGIGDLGFGEEEFFFGAVLFNRQLSFETEPAGGRKS